MMPGPAPRVAPELQKGKGKPTVLVDLAPDEMPPVPPMPDHPQFVAHGEKWHKRSKEWWRVIWSSPMVTQWTEVDRLGLEMYLELVDAFHKAERTQDKVPLLVEMRLQSQRFGLHVMDRWRLKWTIQQAEKKPTGRAPAKPKEEAPREDPRLRLA